MLKEMQCPQGWRSDRKATHTSVFKKIALRRWLINTASGGELPLYGGNLWDFEGICLLKFPSSGALSPHIPLTGVQRNNVRRLIEGQLLAGVDIVYALRRLPHRARDLLVGFMANIHEPNIIVLLIMRAQNRLILKDEVH